MTSNAPDVSVVVPTRDRPTALVRCLGALERQGGCGQLEIVVVDDGSVDPDTVARVVERSPKARLIRRENAGPAAARNAGARAAAAPVVLFTDDDCEPAPDWAACLAAALRAGADAAAGRTINGRPDDPLAEASHTIANYLADRALEQPPRTSFAPSNNLGCKAATLTAVPFDEGYPDAAGEDRDWCARISSLGYVLVTESSAIVAHRHEVDFPGFWRQHVRYGRAAYRFRRSHASAGWLESPWFYGSLIRRGFRRGIRTGILVCIAQAATLIGFLREAVARVYAAPSARRSTLL